jgi:hypothetical protein
MRQPAVLGFTILGATFLLCLVLAWAAVTDTEGREDLQVPPFSKKAKGRSRTLEKTLRACPLCGMNVPLGQNAGCPVIEAFGFVTAESKRARAEGPTLS